MGKAVVISLLLALVSYVLVPVLKPVYQYQRKTNYRGIDVPVGLGTAFILPCIPVLVFRFPENRDAPLTLTALLVFTVLGLLDDFLGSDAKGFRGHFRSGQISTGVVKAVGGVITSFFISFVISQNWWQLLFITLLIALSANFLNLLDLAPGRAGKGFILFSLFLLPFGVDTQPFLIWLVGAVVGYLPWDLREEVMMGDVGSNALGAVLGLHAGLVLPTFWQAALVFALIVLHILAEKVSFSDWIRRSRVLNFLDSLGRGGN